MHMDLRELRWLCSTEKKEPPHQEWEESTLLQIFHVENPIVCVVRVELSVQRVQTEQTHLEEQDLSEPEALEILEILEALEPMEAMKHIEGSRDKDAGQQAEQEQPEGHVAAVAVVADAADETECSAPSPSLKTHISEEDTPFWKC